MPKDKPVYKITTNTSIKNDKQINKNTTTNTTNRNVNKIHKQQQ